MILLFDLDGTLTTSGIHITDEMIKTLENLKNHTLGIVGGGTYYKIMEQLGVSAKLFKYIFAECGSVVYIDNLHYHTTNLFNNLTKYEKKYLNTIIQKAIYCISQMPIIFGGHHIEFRNGLVYISPPGMQSSGYERNIFMKKDKKYNLRKNLINALKECDNENKYDIKMGGSVGVALYKKGHDKSQIMKYFDNIDNIHFFGDQTEPDGNDYPLYNYPGVIGHKVNNYHDTIMQLQQFIN